MSNDIYFGKNRQRTEVRIGLLFIVGLALYIRLMTPTGIITSEGMERARNAFEFVSAFREMGNFFTTLSHQVSAIGRINFLLALPISLSYLVWGVNDYSSVLFSAISSVIIVLLLYAITTKITKSRSAGFIAAYLWTVLPLAIFFDSSLLLATPVTALCLGAVYCLLLFRDKRDWQWIVGISILLMSAFFIDPWVALAPTLFISIYIIEDYLVSMRIMLWIIFVSISVAGILSGHVNSNVLNGLFEIKESYLLIPLLAVALIVPRTCKKENPTQALLWLLSTGLLVIFGSVWFESDPSFQRFGVSKIWLVMLIPVLILVANYLSLRISLEEGRLLVIACSVLLGALLYFASDWTLDNHLSILTALSQIAIGAAFITVWVSVWGKGQKQRWNLIITFLTLFFLGLGSFSTSATYRRSYQAGNDYLELAFQAINDISERTFLVVENQEIANRIEYTKGFEWLKPNDLGLRQNPITFLPNNPNKPENAYVILSENYVNFNLVLIPGHWTELTFSELPEESHFRVFDIP